MSPKYFSTSGLAYSQSVSGTMESPQGSLGIDGTGTGTSNYSIAADGRLLKGTTLLNLQISVSVPSLPEPIPVTSALNSTITGLRESTMTMQDPRSGPASAPRSTTNAPGSTVSPPSTPGMGGTGGPNRPDNEDQGTIGQMKDRIGEQVGPATDQVQEKTGQAFSQARQQVTSRLDSQMDRAAEGLMHTAHAIRQTGQQLRQQNQAGAVANYTDQAAEKVEHFASYLEEHDTNDILRETERLARQKPVAFLASAFALGLAAARFFRSSPSQMNGGQYGSDPYRSGPYGSRLSSGQFTPGATYPMQRTSPPSTSPSTTPSSTLPSSTSPSSTSPSQRTPQSGSETSNNPGGSSSSQTEERQPGTPITPPRNRGS